MPKKSKKRSISSLEGWSNVIKNTPRRVFEKPKIFITLERDGAGTVVKAVSYNKDTLLRQFPKEANFREFVSGIKITVPGNYDTDYLIIEKEII